MKTIHRYILAETVGPCIIGLFAFSLVVLLHRFTLLSDLVIAKGIPPGLVGTLLLSLFPGFLEITLPAALLLGVLLAVGRLSADSETTAMQSAGIGIRKVAFPVVLLSTAAFLISLLVAWSGLAWGQRAFKTALTRVISIRAGAGASEHVFQEIAPGVLLFPDRVSADGTRMTGVLLSQWIDGKGPVLIFASEGAFTPESPGRPLTLSLGDGTIHHGDEADGAYRIASFRKLTFRLPRETAFAGVGDDPRGMTLPALWRKVAETGGTGRDATYRYHFHRRLSLSFSCLVFGLIGVPLGLSQRTRGRSPAFVVTILVIIAYYLFLAAGGALESGAPRLMTLVIWLPDAIGLAFVWWVFRRSESRPVSLPSILALFRPGR